MADDTGAHRLIDKLMLPYLFIFMYQNSLVTDY